MKRHILEALYHLSVSEDESAMSTLSTAGVCTVVSSVLKTYCQPKRVQSHEELAMQAVRLCIAMMQGKSDLSKANAEKFNDAGISSQLALMLKMCDSNDTHVTWLCTCISMLCSRAPASQESFGKDADICTCLSNAELWSRFTDTPTVVSNSSAGADVHFLPFC